MRRNKWEPPKKIYIPEARCAKCGKNFVVPPEPIFVDGYGRRYCKWTCYNHRDDEKRSKACKAVEQYTIDGVLLAVYPSMSQAAFVVGCEERQIRAACKGKIKTSMGYVWKYKDNESL